MQRKPIREMFGDGAKIVVDSLEYSTNLKMPTCSVTLYVKDVDSSLDFFPFGLEQIVLDSFTLLSLGKELIITISIKELDNGTSTTTR